MEGNFVLNILRIIIFILIVFMFLVFIEVIEINIFNLSYNTKKNIEIRSKKEPFIDMNYIINPDEDIKENDDNSISTNSMNNNTN